MLLCLQPAPYSKMTQIIFLTILIVGVCLYPSQSYKNRKFNNKFLSLSINSNNKQVLSSVTSTSSTRNEYQVDSRDITEASLVEYISSKGNRRLAIVNKRTAIQIEIPVMNDARKTFSVPMSRITYHINGTFVFGDLLRLTEIVADLRPMQVSRLRRELRLYCVHAWLSL